MYEKKLKLVFIIVIIVVFCGLAYALCKKNIETPDNLYIKINEINNNQTLIGLSKKEVVELLGEPRYEYNDKENKIIYKFSAGKTIKKSFLGNTNYQKYYELKVFFDENDRVEYTYIQLST